MSITEWAIIVVALTCIVQSAWIVWLERRITRLEVELHWARHPLNKSENEVS